MDSAQGPNNLFDKALSSLRITNALCSVDSEAIPKQNELYMTVNCCNFDELMTK